MGQWVRVGILGFFCGAAKGSALWVSVDTGNGRRHPEIGYSVSVGGQNKPVFHV
jgi:hypothetical protein